MLGLCENNTDKTVHSKYYLPSVKIKDYNVVIDGQNCFDKLVKRLFKNI